MQILPKSIERPQAKTLKEQMEEGGNRGGIGEWEF